MVTFNYRLIRTADGFGAFEVYDFGENGIARLEEPETGYFETAEEVVSHLQMVLDSIRNTSYIEDFVTTDLS